MPRCTEAKKIFRALLNSHNSLLCVGESWEMGSGPTREPPPPPRVPLAIGILGYTLSTRLVAFCPHCLSC